MPNAIAFFPWIRLDEPITVGPVRLLPYKRRLYPGGNGSAAQADFDGILKAYATRKNHTVKHATMMEINTWRLGQNTDATIRADLFRAREFVGFAALTKRRLFRGHFDYCSFDNYFFVIQNYQAAHTGAFSYATRRRDGGTSYMWDTKEFTFLKPLHVAADTKLTLDETLLAALFRADDADRVPYDAIVEFNRANTDSQDIPIHTELVMAKSAFEFLLGVRHEADEFVNAILPLIPERSASEPFRGPLAERWPQRRGDRAIRPLEAWIREFCIRRNEGAHGRQRRGREHFIWSDEAHLAFVSLLFPLLVKQKLAREGFLEMRETDDIELAWIEAYLMHDPFASGTSRTHQSHEHPWSRIYSEDVLGEKLRRRLAEQMETIDWSKLPRDENEQ